MAATKANSIVMTEGRPLPQIIRFSVPLALTGILQLLFNAADVIVVGKFDSSTALAASSEEEALGEVNIYNGEQKLSYLSINGRIRELIYTYFNHVDANGRTKEIPAYCVNPNIYGGR